MYLGGCLWDAILQRPLDLDDVEGLDDVAFLDVVVAGDAHTALAAGGDFLGGVLADLQGAELAGVDDDAVYYERRCSCWSSYCQR